VFIEAQYVWYQWITDELLNDPCEYFRLWCCSQSGSLSQTQLLKAQTYEMNVSISGYGAAANLDLFHKLSF
jgi:hypothetical protein